MAVKKVGRFNIVRELGRGAQGAVYLADDTQLERQVAIKTLRPGAAQQTDRLLHEARIVSKLQHPNIVSLYDAGEQQGEPYLVYAYIEGGTLATMLKGGALPLVKSVEIACSLLEALEYAHQQGVMHLDIKPANIMMGQRGQPMLMDFGIARLMQDQAATEEIVGSPQYMAPECFSNQELDASADLYSVGMVLYEMLTGRAAYSGDNVFQVMNRVAHEPVIPPSTYKPELDANLEAIILKSVGKRREDRYRDAAGMRDALRQFLIGAGAKAAGDSNSTLEFLLRRMRSKSDFPALSSIITEINTIVASESESASKLARVILQDFALTNKLLRLVNTVTYGQFGGSIFTISKAVVILGFETVRNIAMSLILLEFMQNRSLAHQLRDEVTAAFFAGVVATQLSAGRNIKDDEELMICSMFFSLGRMLVTFYFFEESNEVSRLVEQGLSEEQAAIKVLGLTYNEIGVGVAKSWNFPKRLLKGMEKWAPEDEVGTPQDDANLLRVTVNLSNELCKIASTTAPAEKSQALNKLRLRYKEAIELSERKLNESVDSGLQELSRRDLTLGINTARSPLIHKVRQWSGQAAEQPVSNKDSGKGLGGVHGIESALNDVGQAPKTDPETVLGAGIQDVTNSLVEDFNLNDVLLMVLETIYRGLGFKRALICIRDNKMNTMAARIGLGEGVDAVIPRFRFKIDFEPDVFHLAIKEGADIVIEDVSAGSIASKIPGWYRGLVDAQSFVLLPVVINKRTVGMFYADMQEAHSLKLSEKQLSLLRTLRNQAVLAIKQKM